MGVDVVGGRAPHQRRRHCRRAADRSLRAGSNRPVAVRVPREACVMKSVRALVSALLMLFCCLVPGESFAFQFGACIHLALNRSDAPTVLRLVDAGGFNTVRDDFYWSSV